MLELSNHLANSASNGMRTLPLTTLCFAGNRNRGEVIMNPVQKAAAAVMSLAITLVGATLATAPLVLAAAQPVASHLIKAV
jgi:hypothetical protein